MSIQRPTVARTVGNHEGRLRDQEREVEGRWFYFLPIAPADVPADYVSGDPNYVPYEAAWSNVGTDRPASGYKRERGRLWLRLSVMGDEGNPGSLIATTPEGFRPPVTQPFIMRMGDDSAALVNWQSDGQIIFVNVLGAGDCFCVPDPSEEPDDYVLTVYAGGAAWLPAAGGGVPTSRTLTAGDGLSGGGDLSADRSFAVNVDGTTIETSADALRVKSGVFDAAGAAAAAQAASQPLDSDLTAIAALSTTSFGRSLLELANSAALLSAAGADPAGAAAAAQAASAPTSRTLTAGDGLSGGGDLSTDRSFAVNVDGATIETSADTLRVKDAGITEAKLGFSNITTNDASTSQHGLLPKLDGVATHVFDGKGAWVQSDPTRLVSIVAGILAESFPWWKINSNVALLSSGRLSAIVVPVVQGVPCTNVSFCSATTAFNGPQNWWFALCDSSFNVIRQSTDQLTAAWAASTPKTLAMDSIPVTAGARVASTTVTLTIPTLSESLTSLVAVGDSITVANANIAAYNGTFTVASVSSTQITYTSGGSATDSLVAPFPTVKLAAGKRVYTTPADGYVFAVILAKASSAVPSLACNTGLSSAIDALVFTHASSGDTGLTGTCPSPIAHGTGTGGVHPWGGIT